VAPRAEPPPGRTFVFLEGGYALQSLYKVPMTAVDVSASAEHMRDDFAVGVTFDSTIGTTQDGLHTFALTLGPLVEARIDRLRLGGGVRLGMFNASRVTTGGGIFGVSAGAFARFSVDVVDLDAAHTQAIFVVLKGGVDAVGGALYGASLGLGARF
jgi:hypothetical protein